MRIPFRHHQIRASAKLNISIARITVTTTAADGSSGSSRLRRGHSSTASQRHAILMSSKVLTGSDIEKSIERIVKLMNRYNNQMPSKRQRAGQIRKSVLCFIPQSVRHSPLLSLASPDLKYLQNTMTSFSGIWMRSAMRYASESILRVFDHSDASACHWHCLALTCPMDIRTCLVRRCTPDALFVG